jgi:predicted metalloprotease
MATADERRKDKRLGCPPDLLTVTFILGDGSEQGQIWELRVLEVSTTGIKLLVTDVDSELLATLRKGYVVENMTFYGEETLIRVDGTVKHITRIGTGEYKGMHAIGIHSDEIITSSLPVEEDM